MCRIFIKVLFTFEQKNYLQNQNLNMYVYIFTGIIIDEKIRF